MQFPVPQFTDVEDRIIGPLTLKQFLILLGTGGVVFFAYSLSKDYLITGAAAVLIGIPGLVVAFAPFNGRPMYSSLTVFLNFWTRPKFFVFQKQVLSSGSGTVKDLKQAPAHAATMPTEDPRNRLKKIQYQLEQREKQEEELLGKRK
jgi:hypothetical protein